MNNFLKQGRDQQDDSTNPQAAKVNILNGLRQPATFAAHSGPMAGAFGDHPQSQQAGFGLQQMKAPAGNSPFSFSPAGGQPPQAGASPGSAPAFMPGAQPGFMPGAQPGFMPGAQPGYAAGRQLGEGTLMQQGFPGMRSVEQPGFNQSAQPGFPGSMHQGLLQQRPDAPQIPGKIAQQPGSQGFTKHQNASIEGAPVFLTFEPGVYVARYVKLDNPSQVLNGVSYPLASIMAVDAGNGGDVRFLNSAGGCGWFTREGEALAFRVEGGKADIVLTTYKPEAFGPSGMHIEISKLDK